MRILTILLLLFWCGTGTLMAATLVEMKTSHGTVQIELYPEKAPATVENFLAYVDRGFYDGTIFHRIIRGFMIQGGGFDKNDRRKETAPPIINEADNGLKNRTGSLAMARTNQVDSATSQFFINLTDNDFLNHRTHLAMRFLARLSVAWMSLRRLPVKGHTSAITSFRTILNSR